MAPYCRGMKDSPAGKTPIQWLVKSSPSCGRTCGMWQEEQLAVWPALQALSVEWQLLQPAS